MVTLTFPAADFAASVLGRHVPLDAGVQHAEQHVHAREGLGLPDGRLPLLHGSRNLRERRKEKTHISFTSEVLLLLHFTPKQRMI